MVWEGAFFLLILRAVWLICPSARNNVQAPVGAFSVGFPPFVTYDATHALTVIAIYCVTFAAIAYYLTWRRDVLE